MQQKSFLVRVLVFLLAVLIIKPATVLLTSKERQSENALYGEVFNLKAVFFSEAKADVPHPNGGLCLPACTGVCVICG